MSDQSIELRFTRGSVDAATLESFLAEVLAEFGEHDSHDADWASEHGIDAQAVAESNARVREEAHGLEPISTTVLVTIGTGLGLKILESLWDDVLWPRLRRKFGADALGDRLGEDQGTRED
jgi:hypothetical protein